MRNKLFQILIDQQNGGEDTFSRKFKKLFITKNLE